jgi:hypothetical protein
MAGTAEQIQKITTEELRNVSVNFADLLDSGELLTGTPTVVSDTDVTIDNEQVNDEIIIINNESVAVGNAVQFTVECAVAGNYTVEIKVSTDAGQVLEGLCILKVIDTVY